MRVDMTLIEITNLENGEWVWKGKLTGNQVFQLCKLADELSDEAVEKGIWHGQATPNKQGDSDES